jgi:hypothetical protein
VFKAPPTSAAGRPACRCSAWDRPGSAAAESEQAMRASVFRWMTEYLSWYVSFSKKTKYDLAT